MADANPNVAVIADSPGITQEQAQDTARSWKAVLASSLPTFLILGTLAGLAFWGHHSGWTLPKFGELTGAAAAIQEDWCEEHSVPKSICVECNPDKYPRLKNYGWCEKHGVHNCPECHPDIAQVEGKPQMPKYDTLKALALVERQPNGHGCSLHVRRLQFASDDAAAKLGVEFDVVSEHPMTDQIDAIAEVNYDPAVVARLSSPVAGRISQVRKGLGDEIQKGDVLALIDSPQIAEAKAEFVAAVIALKTAEQKYSTLIEMTKTVSVPRLSLVETKGARDEAAVKLAKTAQLLSNLGLAAPEGAGEMDSAQLTEKMRFLGVPADLVKELSGQTTSSSLFPLKAPQSGIVTDLDLVVGEFVDTNRTLMVLADRQHMLLSMSLTAEQVKYVRKGLPVRFVSESGESTVEGSVSWISSAVDDTTRMLKVRASLTAVNADTRANTFGTAHIILREEPNAMVVPRECVQWDGCCNVVFVRDKNYRKPDAPKVIYARKVRPGASDAKFVELIAGVLPGEVVVSKGSDVLRAQMLKNNLGAG
jgi:cobalt-zinc-cadmium efflux system membrane fusion protein